MPLRASPRRFRAAKWIKPIPAITWATTVSVGRALETRGRVDDRRQEGREVPGP